MQKSVKLSTLKRGEMFTLKDISQPSGKQVWIKDEYDRTEKKYLITNFDDFNRFRLIKGNTVVYTDFWF